MRDGTARRVGDHCSFEHDALVRLEIGDRSRDEVLRQTEPGYDDLRFLPVGLTLRVAQSTHDELVQPQRCQDERALDPEEQGRIARVVFGAVRGDATNGHVPSVDACHRAPRGLGVSEHDGERRVQRAQQSAVRRAAEVGVLVDSCRDERVRDLKQERGRPTEQDEHLAIDAPRDGIGRQQTLVAHR